MSWRSAFILQARSDNNIRRLLNRERVEYAHQLHYLQMTTEKLAKALLIEDEKSGPPPFTHSAFVIALKMLKGRRDVRRRLGYNSHHHFSAAVDSLMPFAARIERLALSFAGSSRPNAEYPWQSTAAHDVVAPVQFAFPEFDSRLPQMAKLVSFVEELLVILR